MTSGGDQKAPACRKQLPWPEVLICDDLLQHGHRCTATVGGAHGSAGHRLLDSHSCTSIAVSRRASRTCMPLGGQSRFGPFKTYTTT